MPQRKLPVLAPSPSLSPAFRVHRSFYDRPGTAALVLEANLDRLARLAECQQVIIKLLRDPLSKMVLELNSSLNSNSMNPRDALLHQTFSLAIREVFSRNSERIEQALQLESCELPAEHERQHAANLYAAHPDATWLQIGVARQTYHASEWLLGYAGSGDNGRGIAISQALIEASAGLVAAPGPELAEAYQGWAAAVLANLPEADSCNG